MADKVQIDGAGVQVIYDAIPKIEIDGVGLQLVYDLIGKVEVDGIGVQIVYSDIFPPAKCTSVTTVSGLIVPIVTALSKCVSITTVGVCPIVPPATCRSLTTVGVCTIIPLANCRSLSRIEAIAAAIANIHSLTTSISIPTVEIGKCSSATLSQPLVLAIPHACASASRCQAIPPFNSGLMLIM